MTEINIRNPGIRLPFISQAIEKSLLEIEEEKARRAEQNPPRVDRMSSSGRCWRERWATFHGLPKDPGKGFSGNLLKVFRLGHIIEDEVVGLLGLADFKVTDQQREVGNGFWIGHIDGILTWSTPGSAVEVKSLLEIKSAKNSRFELLEKLGYEEWNPGYAAQLHAYMAHIPEVTDAVVVVYNKDTSETYVERVFQDLSRADSLRHESIIVTESETVPPRPEQATSQGCKFCRWCDRSEWCWNPATDVRFDP